MKQVLLAAALAACVATGLAAQAPGATQLGTINFPTSAEAGRAGAVPRRRRRRSTTSNSTSRSTRSSEAQKADPAFALAYWGEAMSYNHPLWAQQDLAAARRVARAARADGCGPRRESARRQGTRCSIESLDVLFGGSATSWRATSPTPTRWSRMHEKYPEDDEICDAFYALALLGTARPGEKNIRNAMQAAAIVEGVFQRNPQHPGAAHYIIHSFDDPDHAILALPAARAYSKIAPSAAHALHMPSHIFVQLGMWDDVVQSNIVAYKAAVDLAEAKNLPRGREDFHTLVWLQYAYLQQGKFDEAQKCVDQAKAVADKIRRADVRDGYAAMKARQVVETGKWERLALPTSAVRDGGAPGYDGSAAYVFAAGFSAANLGDIATANVALDKLKAMRTQAESGSNAYRAKPLTIMEKEVAAMIAVQREGRSRAAEQHASRKRLRSRLTLDAPSGPPEPIKPSFELYWESAARSRDRPKMRPRSSSSR